MESALKKLRMIKELATGSLVPSWEANLTAQEWTKYKLKRIARLADEAIHAIEFVEQMRSITEESKR